MRRLLLSVSCALTLLVTATVSDAKIFVNISDGTNTLNAQTSTTVPFVKGGLVLSKASLAPAGTLDVLDTLTLLTCAARPCKIHFPSGSATAQAGDTFRLEDVVATTARVEKFDSGATADRVSMKGLRIVALTAGKVLTITYGTQALDLRTLTSTQASSYSASAAFSGFFRTAAGLRAGACKAGTVAADMDSPGEACARLTMAVNGTTVDGQGSTVSTTVAVPCNNAFPTVNPCGTNGSWTSANGTFTGVNDGRSLSCPSACSPAQVATLTARFSAINDVLQLTASTHGAMANVTDENGGVEETALALGTEIGFNRWVTFAAATERCRAEPKSPAKNDTRNITNSSNLPISFELWCGVLAPAGAEGVPLVSLADTMLLPGAAGTRYQASRESFLPTPLQLAFKDITTLSFSYDVFVGDEPTAAVDHRLDGLTYVDCKDGSIRLEIQLQDSGGADLGTLRVYLGGTNNGRNGCDAVASTLGPDIVNDPLARVDASGLAGNLAQTAFMTFREAQRGQIGKAFVRKIAFVVGRPVSPASDPLDENYKVTFFDGNVNGITALSSLQKVTGEVRITEGLTPNGVSVTITKLTMDNPGVVKVIPSSQILFSGGKFTTTTPINDIDPQSGAKYSISLCPFGTTDNDQNLAANTVLGICIDDPAIMTLL